MGQKVNPISLRLQKTNRHFDSCWYDDYNYTHLLLQDLKIKNYLKTVLDQIKYPESRVINLGVPKRNIYNLFYYNPSNSRRKKNKRFQLQNFKEKNAQNAQNGQTSKNKKGFFKQKINIKERVDSFFSFPKQQYWKNNTFTLAQQRVNGVTDSSPLLLLTSHITDTSEEVLKGNLSTLQTSLLTSPKVMSDVSSVGKKSDVKKVVLKDDVKTKESVLLSANTSYTTEESVRSLPFVSTVNGMMMSRLRSPKIYCDKKKSFFDINQLLLEFVMKNNNNSSHLTDTADITKDAVSGVKPSNTTKGGVSANKSVTSRAKQITKGPVKSDVRILNRDLQNSNIQRFFVRYLLAQLYCNYLQNKDNYNKETVTTLSRFLVFFQEKNVENGVFLKKYRNLKSGNEKVSYTHIADHITSTITSPLKIGEESVSDVRSSLDGQILTSLTPPEVNKSEMKQRKHHLGDVSAPKSLQSLLLPTLQSSVDRSPLVMSDVKICQSGQLAGLTPLAPKSSICQSVRCNSFSGFFQSKKNNLFDITRSDVKKKKNIPLYIRSGVYSSNLVYKSHLEFSLSKQYSSGFTVNLFRTLIEKQSAFFWVQEIIYYLERKIPFRRIKTQILKEVPHYKHIKGIRIKCSGRVGGRSKKAQRSKTQSVKMGQTSLGVFSSKIDFACKSAFTRFGLVGVKVWVCYK